MGQGTVPIVTDEVAISSYIDSPKENVHYIKVSRPDEIPNAIKAITETEWTKMSNACVEWFERTQTWDHTISHILYGLS